jgi:integrase
VRDHTSQRTTRARLEAAGRDPNSVAPHRLHAAKQLQDDMLVVTESAWRLTDPDDCEQAFAAREHRASVEVLLDFACAQQLRGRIEVILNREKALKHRSGENPAVWLANLNVVFPETKDVKRVKHHTAMNYQEIGNFMVKLRAASFVVDDDGRRTPDIINHALEFTILCCSRTNEVLGANWGEIDLDQKLWTIPPERMKGKRNREREHRVPLSERAIEILKTMQAIKVSSFVFPGRREGKSLSATVLEARLRQMEPVATVHGFRSTFRDWVGDETDFPGELAEVALAHKVGNAVEQAYRRGDGLKKRYVLAEAWSKFCDQQPINDGSNVVNFRGSAK